jgi:hypothetical protein
LGLSRLRLRERNQSGKKDDDEYDSLDHDATPNASDERLPALYPRQSNGAGVALQVNLG